MARAHRKGRAIFGGAYILSTSKVIRYSRGFFLSRHFDKCGLDFLPLGFPSFAISWYPYTRVDYEKKSLSGRDKDKHINACLRQPARSLKESGSKT